MKIKLLLSVFMLFGSFYLSAQTEPQNRYLEKELQAFSEIYKYKLDHPFDVVEAMINGAKQLTISEKRMGEIIQAQFAGNAIKLTKKEEQQLSKLKTLMEIEKNAHEKRITAFIVSKHMKPSKFEEIEQSFQRDRNLQARVIKQTKTN